ncbi:Hint domain-containing protein [Mameliella alba]|uniref:Hint domain-containing protein n=1 Tax=Mameliella TaxID=1434019 RepID=UPI001C93D237|nr:MULTISPECIES: Hint domain-containing protein [Mameliella]MBY6119548.1 Hint domain-containing protein [Mameliella alba]MDD9730974.1 Hint domain-containing protein [Mameliella sp. AT18]
MAVDYNANFQDYDTAGDATTSGTTDFGGTMIDDGFWNLGDPAYGYSQYDYEGYFVSGGHTFLVFYSASTSQPALLSPSATLAEFPSTFQMGDFALTTDPLPVCFAAGTMIATPDVECAVETLSIGDMIRTADGGTTMVKWIGRQTMHKRFTPAERFAPVRVHSGALGNDLPHTDLVLTADHALVLDGLAINAGALVNGTTITVEPIGTLPERVTYYHIETEGHEIILANGAAAETYVDYVQRRAFDNYAEYLDLYGEEPAIVEMPLPRVSAPRLVPSAIRARLMRERAA